MNRVLVPAACAFLLPCLAAPLCAQADGKVLTEAFKKLDADGDGVLQRKEFPGSDRQFAALDADKDGKATFAEYRESEVGKALLRAYYRSQQDAHERTTPATVAMARFQWLLRADPNRDGKVTRDEWTGTEGAFALLDLDGNGVVDKRDRAEAQALAPPPPPVLPEPKGEVPAPEDLLRRYDRDQDGRLAGKELAADKFLAAAAAWADRDGDGALAEQELRMLQNALVQRRVEQITARERPVPYAVPFDTWDKDKDGKVRQNEWQGPLNLFTAIDVDRDAAVSRDEVLRYQKRVTGEDFLSRFDLDGNGKVTFAEFGGPPAAFRRADTNGDGVVSKADR